MNLDILNASIVGYHFGTLLNKPSIYYMINGLFWILCLLFKFLKKFIFGLTGLMSSARFKFNLKRNRDNCENLNESKGFRFFSCLFITFY